MSLKKDLGLHISTHLESLKTLRTMPPGLTQQLAELTGILVKYDAEVARIEGDRNLSAEGKAGGLRAAHDRAHGAVESWRHTRTAGIDAQIAAQRSALRSAADKALPKPSDLQVHQMVERLSAFDPLEVEILYADASDTERRVIEAASDAVGRQPRRRGEQLVWEPLIAAERVAAVVAKRAERASPDGAAALRDSERIRNTYESLASSAKTLLRQSLPQFAAGGHPVVAQVAN